jgi:hypothetical protein
LISRFRIGKSCLICPTSKPVNDFNAISSFSPG